MIVACLVEVEGRDIKEEDCVGNTPLVLAAKNGHQGVVNISSNRKMSAPVNQVRSLKCHSSVLLRIGTRDPMNILLGRDGVSPVKRNKLG